MKDFLNLQKFNLKERKTQLLVLVFLLLLLLPLINLVQKEIRIRIKGAEPAKLSLVPRELVKTPEGKWGFPVDQDIKVDLLLNTGDYEVDTVEAIFDYDPTVVSAQNIDFTTNVFLPLQNTLVASIKKDQGGNEIGQIYIARTAIPLPPYPDPDQLPPYDPVPAGVGGTMATITFHTLKTATNSALAFDFELGGKNDSNVVRYQSQGEDVLGIVENLIFDVVIPAPTAVLSLSPNSGTFYTGEPFDVQILLDTGQYEVDSVDVVIFYDQNELKATQVTEGTIFATYTAPGGGQNYIDETAGKIQISGQIDLSATTGLSGTNLKFATITFEPLTQSSDAQVNFEFTGVGERNDSNVVEFTQGNDVLGQVVNASYNIGAEPTPTPLPTSIPTPTPTIAPLTPIPTPAPPTPTPTVTPTPAPQVYLNLKIRLQGRDYEGATQARSTRIMIIDTNFNQMVTTNTSGEAANISLSGIIPNTYDFLIKPESFLQKKFSLGLAGGSNTLDASTTLFLAGDIDGSGKVNVLDYNTFLLNFKKEPLHQPSDLDGSGQVNSLDFSLMLSNWNKTGDEEGT